MEIKKVVLSDGTEYLFANNYRNNRSGFVHESTLCNSNGYEIGKNKCQYLNRTWESYAYQTVMRGLVCNLINERYDRILKKYKEENNISRLTAKRLEEVNKVAYEDICYKHYKELLEKL